MSSHPVAALQESAPSMPMPKAATKTTTPVPVSAFNRLLCFFIVATLPFSYAGTIPLGFPLKIYEIMAAILFIGCATSIAVKRRLPFSFLPLERRTLWLAFAYFLAAITSSIFGVFLIKQYPAQVDVQSWSQSPLIATTLKCGYLFLDLFVLTYLIGSKGITITSICNWWFIGAVLAALYGWYLFLVSLHGSMPHTLPGQDLLQRDGPLFPEAIRGGTFREGNHVATFYLVSAALGFAMLCRTRKVRYGVLGLFFLGSIIHSLSTSGSIAAMVFMLTGMGLVGISSRSSLVLILPVFVVTVLASVGLAATPFFQEIVVHKLTGENGMGLSRDERADLVYSGFDMFREHPLLGIGLANFGYLYPYYTSYSPEELNNMVRGEKQITNNVYSEVSTETGVVGFTVFLIFCASILWPYRRGSRGLEQRILLAGLLSLFVAWIAYPTFSILFQWVFFAIVIRSFLETPPNRRAAP